MVFLPQILLLFLFLGFLEDCGYLARVAYLMDRIMRTMNLHGRAFVPMLSGFACAVPAIMATRTMERRRDRILTMMVVPLMTCSARLPVYTLIIGALIPGSHAVTQGLLMVGMYLFSVIDRARRRVGDVSKTVKPLKAKRLPFLIELPPYRFPRMRDVLRMMWGKSSMFLREAGTVILACSIALWALLYFPRHVPAGSPDYAALIDAGADRRREGRSSRRSRPRCTSRAATAAGSATRSSRRSRRSASTGRSASASSARSRRARCSCRRSASCTRSATTPTSKSEPLRAALREAKHADGTRGLHAAGRPLAHDLLRARDAVHEHARGRAPRDAQPALARVPVRVHDGARVGRELPRLPGRPPARLLGGF